MTAEFIGTLILALLTGTWQPAPPERISLELPAAVTFSARWHPNVTGGDATFSILVLEDGSTGMSAVSSLIGSSSAGRSPEPGVGG